MKSILTIRHFHVCSPSMSRCCSEGQLPASSSTSESQTVRLAVRKSLRKRGRQRASCWKHPVLLCSVGHQPRSNSSSILRTHRARRAQGWLIAQSMQIHWKLDKHVIVALRQDPVFSMSDLIGQPLFTAANKHRLPAARDQLGQASIRQVPAAPQVQGAECAAAGSQHTGHNVIVLDLQERQAAVQHYEVSWRLFWGFSFKMDSQTMKICSSLLRSSQLAQSLWFVN